MAVLIDRRSMVSRYDMTEDEILLNYLEQYADTGTAILTWHAWEILRTTLPGLPMPNACAANDGHILLTWDTPDMHFEYEIFPKGIGEFFFMHRITGVTWDYYEHRIDDALPRRAIDFLSLFQKQ